MTRKEDKRRMSKRTKNVDELGNEQPKKSKTKKLVVGGIAALLLFAGCSAVTGGDTETTPTPSSSQNTTTPENNNSPEPVEEPVKEEFVPEYPGATEDDVAVNGGETVNLSSGISITATPVTIVPGIMDDTYLCTNVTYVNGSDKTVSLSDWDFGLQTANGQVLDITIPMIDGSEPLYSTELIPGGTASGDLCFENSSSVPSGEALLIYDPTFSWSMERGVWKNVI